MREYEIDFWGKLRNFNRTEKPIQTSTPKPYQEIRLKAYIHKLPQVATYERRVVVKMSYKNFNPATLNAETKARIQRNTSSAIDYFFRFDENSGFSKSKETISRQEAHEAFNEEAIFKLIISPEDPEVLNKEYIRSVMTFIEKECGRKLDWIAVFHEEGDHPHAHIMISRTSSEGCSWRYPLKLDRKLIYEKIRHYAQNLSTQILGRKPERDIRKNFYQTIHKIGIAAIDHVIKGNPKKNTNLFVPSGSDYYILNKERLAKLPEWKRELVKERLDFLSKETHAGFKKIAGNWRCYSPDYWQTILSDEEKIRRLSNFVYEGQTIRHIHPHDHLAVPISGTIIDNVIIDDNSQKISLLIESDKKELVFIESEDLSYRSLEDLNGQKVEINRERKSSRYSAINISIKGKNKR